MAREVVDTYFNIQKKKSTLENNESTATPPIKPAFTNDQIDEGEETNTTDEQ